MLPLFGYLAPLLVCAFVCYRHYSQWAISLGDWLALGVSIVLAVVGVVQTHVSDVANDTSMNQIVDNQSRIIAIEEQMLASIEDESRSIDSVYDPNNAFDETNNASNRPDDETVDWIVNNREDVIYTKDAFSIDVL